MHIETYKSFLFAFCAGLFSLSVCASANNQKNHSSSFQSNSDTIPKAKQKLVKSTAYNERTNRILVTYADGTKETMTLEQAITKKIIPQPKVKIEKFTPPAIKEEEEVLPEKKDSNNKKNIPGEKDLIIDKVNLDAAPDARAWQKHLEKFLHPVMDNATKQKIPPGTYTVNVRFTV